jgi:cell division protein CrgA
MWRGLADNLDSCAVAPPKRKTAGGRTTPKLTRPGERQLVNPDESKSGVHSSARYTPPVTREMREGKRWVPVLMLALLILGGVIIMARNLVFSGNNWLTIVGLGCILAGLYTATKWR